MPVQKTQTSSIEPLEARIAPAFAAVIDPSSLNGLNGFTINGEAAGDYAGRVSDAGDVNGDGFGDLLIGAQLADASGVADRGASYVVFGQAGGFAATLNLSTLNGTNGFKINGVAASDFVGASVSGAGDVNGDGFDDLLIGAPGADPNGSMSGASYVVFGKAAGFVSTLDLSTLNGANGFKINGVAASDFSGATVSGAGDVNGDGFADLLIGARSADPNGSNSGASYLVFGKAGGFAPTFNLSTLNGVNGFKISGRAMGDYSGISVSGAGDINGDGFGDLIIGAFQADPNGSNSGASYVVFGKAGGFAPTFNLSTLNGTNGFTINGGVANDYSGFAVSSAGDLNGDGFDDLIIGAPLADPNGLSSGASYVLLGAASGFAPMINLSALNGANGFKINGVTAGDYAGVSVSRAGDVNGDGFGDLLIGASGGNPNFLNQGAAYLVFGKAAGFAPTLNLSTLSGADGFKLGGVMADDYVGGSVSGAGDVNGDGFDDVIISAGGADSNGPVSGASYVVFGRGVEINVGDAVASEGDNGTSALQFTVSLSEAGPVPVTVEVTAFDGTAHVGSDYAALGQLGVTFAPGETSKTVTINVVGDTLYESDETLSIVLSDARGGIIREGAAIGTIGNDDGPPLVGITGESVLEGDTATSILTFAVSLSAASGLPAAVNFATAQGTALAGSDYAAVTSGVLNFAPGETTKTISVDVVGDTSIEDHESLSMTLSGATGATIGNETATGTILNDDTTIRISDAGSSLEGDAGATPFAFNVSLEKASALPVTVNYATVDGTANAGSDFTALAPGSQLTFAPGETTKTIAVDVLGDTSVEAHETFSVVLSNATNATIANDTGTGIILNDDTLVRINDASVLEGHSGSHTMTFTVSLSAPTALAVSVDFASADDTATAGTDYTALTPGTLNFAPGETSKTIAVNVLGDTVVEPREIFSIVLSAPANAVIDDAIGLGTILDDDVSLRGKHIATFTDVDGDLVTIKVSKGALKVEDFTLFPSGSGAQLAMVDFSGQTELAGANLSITAKRAAGTSGGVRLVDVGAINASGIDLGKVLVKGDLGQIDSGNDLDSRPGLLSLSVRSLGQRGIDTQLPGGSLQSDIDGALKTLKLVADGMQDAVLSVSGDIGSIGIKGDVLGSLIRSDGKIGVIDIGGDFGGGGTISARGALAPGSDVKALAIGAFSVGGSVDHAQILAGYDRTGAAVNADAAIGRVTVGGIWTASDLAAGVSRGIDAMFGTDDDMLIANGNRIVAKIASILIKGTVNGTEGGSDQFGFVAEQIDAFRSGGAKIALTRGPGNDLAGVLLSPTGDVKVREAA